MPNSAYFVGLCSESTPPRTYASLGPNCRDARPTFGSVYQALLEHPGHVGRILRTVDVSQSVGTSMRPVDPRHDFMDFANSFRELPGTLEQALAGETRLHRLQPIHDCNVCVGETSGSPGRVRIRTIPREIRCTRWYEAKV